MTRKPSVPRIRTTTELDFTLGAFHLSAFRIPYFSTVMPLRDAADYLKLVTDDPRYARQDWTLPELYQREIDHGRVIDIARTYLGKNSVRPQFFNSITVVLRPAQLAEGFVPPQLSLEKAQIIPCGPVVVGFSDWSPTKDQPFPPSGTFGRIAWNLDQTFAVAIDGQHRLAAIKRLVDDSSRVVLDTSISVLLLLFDERVGFSAGDSDELSVMRSLFIDLNKHAVAVSRARNLLLDDLSPGASFVRGVLSETLSFVPDANVRGLDGFDAGTKKEFLTTIPLGLVDWHGEAKSKVDEGPYVTSVLALDWAVKWVLKNTRIVKDGSRIENLPDPGDYESLGDYLDAVDKIAREWPQTYSSHFQAMLQHCRDTDQPFALTTGAVASLRKEFVELFGRVFVRLYCTIRPYQELIRRRIAEDTLTTEFGQWYQAYANVAAFAKESFPVRKQYEDRLSAIESDLTAAGIKVGRFVPTVDKIQKEIKAKTLLFYLVGQRALVIAFSVICNSDMNRVSDEAGLLKGELGKELKSQAECAAYYLVEGINAFCGQARSDHRVFSKTFEVEAISQNGQSASIPLAFWAGSLLKRDDASVIDFSLAAAERGARWLVVMAHLYWRAKTSGKKLDADKIVEASLSEQGESEGVIASALSNSIVQARGEPGDNGGPVAFLMRSFLDSKWNAEIANKLLKARVKALVKALP